MSLYPEIWRGVEKAAPRYLLRLAMIEDVLDRLPTQTGAILEVGPGRGDVAAYLHQARPESSLTLCENSDLAAAHLRTRFSNSVIAIVDDLTALEENSFDVVLLFEVLEHIEDDTDFIAQVLRPLRPGGHLILSVPSYMNKWQHQDAWAGHVRRYEFDELGLLLRRAGLTETSIIDFGFPFMNLIQPLKHIYYRAATQKSLESSDEEKTAASGVSRSGAVSILSSFVKPVLRAFAWIQSPFRNRRLGDGFIVTGTLRD